MGDADRHGSVLYLSSGGKPAPRTTTINQLDSEMYGPVGAFGTDSYYSRLNALSRQMVRTSTLDKGTEIIV